MLRISYWRCATLILIPSGFFHLGCSEESTRALLHRWNPQPAGAPESEESSKAGTELQYRMASDELTEAQSQRYLDLTYKLDLFGARRQLARTARTWPLDGHAFVRVVTVYPVTTTRIRWRREGDRNWRIVSTFGGSAYLDLGTPSPGSQSARIEYELFRAKKRLWHGILDVSYDGHGRLQDQANLVDDPSAGEWLKGSLYPTLRISPTSEVRSLDLYPPLTSDNPTRLHLAFKVELVRDGVVVGEGYANFGPGREPGSLCSPLPLMSIEWLRPDLALHHERATWTIRLSSIPELAATAELDELHGSDPVPRPVWTGSIDLPVILQFDIR